MCRQQSIFSICIGLFFLPIFLWGQNTSVGLKGALSSNQVRNSSFNESRLGFRGGVFITRSILRDFGVSVEANYARKGGQNASGANLNLDYLELPVLAHYFVGSGSFRPKLILGPYFSYLLSATRDGQEVGNYTREEIGLMAGLGFHHSLGNRRWLYVDLRYSLGLTPVITTTAQVNQGLSFNLGISFPFKNT